MLLGHLIALIIKAHPKTDSTMSFV